MASTPPIPVLKKIPQGRRNLLFVPVAIVSYFVFVPIIGVITQDLIFAFLLALLPGLAVAYVLFGLPKFSRDPREIFKKTVPRLTREARRILFIPGFIVIAIVTYMASGILLTGGPVGPDLLALAAIGVALVVSGVVSALLFGLPDTRAVMALLPNVPPEQRPALFLPVGLLLATFFFFLLGIAITQVVTERDYGALAAFALSIVLGFGIAYRVFGLPSPKRLPVDRIPRVAPELRSYAFIATVLALGPVLAVVSGGLLASRPEINADMQLYAGILAGFLLSVVVAWRLFGLPTVSTGLLDYIPRLPAGARPLLFFPIWFIVAGAMAVAVETVLKVELYPVLLGSLAMGFVAAVFLTGRTRRFARSPGEVVGGMTETGRATLFVPTALALGTILYFLFGYLLGDAVLTILAAYPLAFLLTFFVFEGKGVGEALKAGREKRARDKGLRDAVKARIRQERY